MLKRYALSIVVVVVFVVLLAVVLLTQPKSDTSSTAANSGAATATTSPDQAKLQIIQLTADDTVNKVVISEPSATLPVTPTVTPAPVGMTVLPTASTSITPTATPFVPLTVGQPRQLGLNYITPKTTWVVAGNSGFPLDSASVASTVQQLSSLTAAAALPAEANNNLAQYGLDKPALKISIESSKGGAKTLDVGNVNSLNSNYWIKLEGGTQVWTVAPGLIDTLKGWLDSPPQLPPTPVPLPTTAGTASTTAVSSGTPVATPAVTGTVTSSSSTTPSTTSTPASSSATAALTTTTAAIASPVVATPTTTAATTTK